MKAVAVVGFRGSGKTTLASMLIAELRRRGYRVAVVKHAKSGISPLAKDSGRLLEAGAERVLALSEGAWEELGRGSQGLSEALAILRGFDFLVAEGFKESFPGVRIAVVRDFGEAEELDDELVVAFASPGAKAVGEVRGKLLLPFSEVGRLADLVEERAFEPPAGLNCGRCRYGSCLSLARAILRGEASPLECTALRGARLEVNGVEVPLNPFVSRILSSLLLAFVRELKGVGEPRVIRVEVRV